MITAPENLMKMQSDAIKASSAAAAKTLEGFQKLAALNMQTSKVALEQSQEQIKALLAARDAKLLSELVTSFAQPAPEQFSAYAKAVYAISKDTGTELASMIEKQVAAGNEQLQAAIEALAQNAPAGSEGSVNFVKQSLAAANKAYDQITAATRQFVEMAEANTQGAVKAASAKKR